MAKVQRLKPEQIVTELLARNIKNTFIWFFFERPLRVGNGHYGDDARKTSLLSKEDSACRVLGTQ